MLLDETLIKVIKYLRHHLRFRKPLKQLAPEVRGGCWVIVAMCLPQFFLGHELLACDWRLVLSYLEVLSNSVWVFLGFFVFLWPQISKAKFEGRKIHVIKRRNILEKEKNMSVRTRILFSNSVNCMGKRTTRWCEMESKGEVGRRQHVLKHACAFKFPTQSKVFSSTCRAMARGVNSTWLKS